MIPCAEKCQYQKDGYCGLESVTAVSNTNGGCAYYKRKSGGPAKEPLQDSLNSFPDAPDANQLHI